MHTFFQSHNQRPRFITLPITQPFKKKKKKALKTWERRCTGLEGSRPKEILNSLSRNRSTRARLKPLVASSSQLTLQKTYQKPTHCSQGEQCRHTISPPRGLEGRLICPWRAGRLVSRLQPSHHPTPVRKKGSFLTTKKSRTSTSPVFLLPPL